MTGLPSGYEIRPNTGWFSHDTPWNQENEELSGGKWYEGTDLLDRGGLPGVDPPESRVAYYNGEPVASVTWTPVPGWGNMIGTAWTHPDHRQKGLFNALTQELRESPGHLDAYHWDNPWLKNKVRGWHRDRYIARYDYLTKHAATIEEQTQLTPQDVVDRTIEQGGCTVDDHWQLAGGGWLVSEAGGLALPADELTPEILQAFMDEKHPPLLGTWMNDGMVYVDSTHLIQDREQAIMFGINHQQQAIYNDLTDELIDLSPYYDTATAHTAAMPQFKDGETVVLKKFMLPGHIVGLVPAPDPAVANRGWYYEIETDRGSFVMEEGELERIPDTPHMAKLVSDNPQDPNAQWTPSYQAPPINGPGQDGSDYIDLSGALNNAAKLETEWQNLPEDKQRQAVFNAFKVALLSPRKHIKWNAAHYQALQHMAPSTPATELWNTLEQERVRYNQSLGYPEDSHLAYRRQLEYLASILQEQNPQLDWPDVYKAAKELIYEKTKQYERALANDPVTDEDISLDVLPEEEGQNTSELRRYNNARRLVAEWLKQNYTPGRGWMPGQMHLTSVDDLFRIGDRVRCDTDYGTVYGDVIAVPEQPHGYFLIRCEDGSQIQMTRGMMHLVYSTQPVGEDLWDSQAGDTTFPQEWISAHHHPWCDWLPGMGMVHHPDCPEYFPNEQYEEYRREIMDKIPQDEPGTLTFPEEWTAHVTAMAERSGDPPYSTVFHVAPRRKRKEIEQFGIDHTRTPGEWRSDPEYADAPYGNYVFSDPETAFNWIENGDVWEIPTYEYPWTPDPKSAGAWYTEQPIRPEHIRRVGPEEFFKQSMAERSGDPQLDSLIEEFLAERAQEYPEGDPLRTEEGAYGYCADVSEDFADWLDAKGVKANTPWDEPAMKKLQMPWYLEGRDPTPDDFGLTDRGIQGEDEHHTTIVQMPSGTYSVDWTAAQYGYTEFPMVQKLQDNGWARQWESKTAMGEAAQVMYHVAPRSARESILQHGLDWEMSDPSARLEGEWPRGQYLFAQHPGNLSSQDDVWEVNVDGLNVEPDPYEQYNPWADNSGQFLIREPISPERLRLLGQERTASTGMPESIGDLVRGQTYTLWSPRGLALLRMNRPVDPMNAPRFLTYLGEQNDGQLVFSVGGQSITYSSEQVEGWLQNQLLNLYQDPGPGRIEQLVDPMEETEAPDTFPEEWTSKVSAVPLNEVVYIAEDAMKRAGQDGGLLTNPIGHPFHPTEEGRAASAAMTEKAREICGSANPGVTVHISDWVSGPGGDQGHASYDRMYNSITIRPESDMLTFLHECAHAITGTSEGDGHTPEFCETARQLYAQYISPEAADTFWGIVSFSLGQNSTENGTVLAKDLQDAEDDDMIRMPELSPSMQEQLDQRIFDQQMGWANRWPLTVALIKDWQQNRPGTPEENEAWGQMYQKFIEESGWNPASASDAREAQRWVNRLRSIDWTKYPLKPPAPEDASGLWPDTLPWSEEEQQYYRGARTKKSYKRHELREAGERWNAGEIEDPPILPCPGCSDLVEPVWQLTQVTGGQKYAWCCPECGTRMMPTDTEIKLNQRPTMPLEAHRSHAESTIASEWSATSSEDYRGLHQAPDESYGAPLYDLHQLVAEDIYDPKVQEQYYGLRGMDEDPQINRECFSVINAVRDQPDAMVTIYRALPADQTVINQGDWITLSPTYAQLHLESNLDPENSHVISAVVPAKQVWWIADSIAEWGYTGPSIQT